MNPRRLPTVFLIAVSSALACRSVVPPQSPSPATATPPASSVPAQDPGIAPGLDAEFLREQVTILASDAMEGRRPGTEGAARAVAHIEAAFRRLGLEPGGPGGAYTQDVPMRAVRPDAAATKLAVRGKKTALDLAFGDDWVGSSFRPGTVHALTAPLVFVGYGITAPEHGWDDYRNDVRGKIVVVLVGDPPLHDGRFAGDALTHYGRWSYKYERALAAGAAGCLIVHEDGPAAYGWNVPRASWMNERSELERATGSEDAVLGFQGWLSRSAAETIARLAGSSLEAWHQDALGKGFRPRNLRLDAALDLRTGERAYRDRNVLGVVRGGSRADEAVIVTAHWDHLGIEASPQGDDRIYNGAIDNATGTAALLAVAAEVRARATSGSPPARSLIFAAVTAEEQGLLGSRYLAEHSPWPVDKIVAALNMDSLNPWDRTRSVQILGRGQNTLEDELERVVVAQGRAVVPEEHPERGSYFRSDHFSFARVGVPALSFKATFDMESGGRDAGRPLAELWDRRYHTVDDEIDPSWTFAGAVQDATVILELAARVADADTVPAWRASSEFARLRPPRSAAPPTSAAGP